MEQNDCLFCKIIKGKLPSSKVYESEKTLAFLDIHPVNIGHTLVISKEHFANIYETPDDVLSDMIIVSKKTAMAIKIATSADGINLAMNNNHAAGQLIFHSHLHVIPRFSNDGFELWHGKRPYNEDEMAEVAEKIKKEIK